MKILIIDDEPLIRRSLRRAAEMKNHKVIEAADGPQGLSIWTNENPDLVYLDVLMPGMSGPDVMQTMKNQGTQAKVILISAYSGEFDSTTLAGANLFIQKPFDDIFEVIEQGIRLVRK